MATVEEQLVDLKAKSLTPQENRNPKQAHAAGTNWTGATTNKGPKIKKPERFRETSSIIIISNNNRGVTHERIHECTVRDGNPGQNGAR